MRSTENYAMRSSFQISGRTLGRAAAVIMLILAGSVGERSNAAVTADRFGGFEDCSIGEGAGKAAPGLSRAYEALVVAQPAERDPRTIPWFPPTPAEQERWSLKEVRDYEWVEEWLERLGPRANFLTLYDFQQAAESCRRQALAKQASRSSVSAAASASVVTKDEEKREAHGPFSVSLSEWTRTDVNLKPGDSITVKASGVFRNERGEVAGGADGWGVWGWFVLIARLEDKQAQYVGSSGGMTATTEGMVELGMPRGMGGKFLVEDAQSYSGGVSVYVFVHRKVGP